MSILNSSNPNESNSTCKKTHPKNQVLFYLIVRETPATNLTKLKQVTNPKTLKRTGTAPRTTMSTDDF